jgi:iron complex outermembrane receptor protein
MSYFLTKKTLHWNYSILVCLLLYCTYGFSQNESVIGSVNSENGEPLIGATVLVKGTTNGVVTDFDGQFSISVADRNNDILSISYTGYITLEEPINGRANISISLTEDLLTLDDVIVVGYSTKRRTDVTGSISSVKAENFNVGLINSPEQLLQAKVPGVRITASSGEPGAAISVNIRGAGSLRSGNSPLYVIDGVPLSNDPVTAAGGNLAGTAVASSSASKNPLNFLNPDDIASIDVLKDASATAIYGSRGSNGVVIITTKTGSSKETKVDYTTFVGFSTVANRINILPTSEDPILTDWQDVIFRPATTISHNLSFSGGGEKAKYRASLSYNDQEGVVRKSSLERYTARLNSTFYAIQDKLQIGINMIGSHVVDNGIPTFDVSDVDGDLIGATLSAQPSRAIFDDQGNYSTGPMHPLEFSESWNDVTKLDRLLISITSSLKLAEGLKYNNVLGLDRSGSVREQELAPNNVDGLTFENGSYAFSQIDASNILVENFLTYDKKFSKHDFNFLLGHAYQRFSVNSTNFAAINYTLPTISAIDNPGNAENINTQIGNGRGFGGIRETNKLESVFGRVNYSFEDKLLVTASLRADGSTKFGENNRWGYFPAVSAAYKFNNLLASLDAIDEFKLRAGWGQTGNQEFPNKASQETFGVDQNGVSLVRQANPDLKWEVSTQINFGLDFALKKNVLYGTIDYFSKVNTDPLLLVASRPPAVSQQWVNLPGEIKNSGIEIFLGSELVSSKDFTWNLDINGTFTSNEVVFSDDRQIFTGQLSGRGASGVLSQVIQNGEQLGTFFLPTDRGENTTQEREIQGSGIPDFFYGINTYLKYKNLDLSMNFSGVSGNKILNGTDIFLNNNGGANSERLANAEFIPGGISSFFLEDGSFLRLNNLSLGYTIPTNKINFLDSARIYVTGQNLFVITDYTGFDPEVNTAANVGGNLAYGIDFGTYPRPRTIIFGLNVKL